MSTNRHKRIIKCLQEHGSLSLSRLTALVNAQFGREYTEGIIAQDLKSLSAEHIVRVDGNGQRLCSLTEYGQTVEVVFGSTTSGEKQYALQWAGI